MINKINFNNFYKKFQLFKEYNLTKGDSNSIPSDLKQILVNLGGKSFNNGLIYIYTYDEMKRYTKIVEKAFPQAKGKIYCFSRDWLNRQFAVINYSPFSILQFDIVFEEIIHLDVTLKDFFEKEILKYKETNLLADEFFQECLNNKMQLIKYNQCVGYRVPPFLGGKDVVDNLQVIDSEIDLELNIQLLNQLKNLHGI